MPQEIPHPTLESLEPGDTFLYAQWKNNPYINIYNAYLLVVNTSDFSDIRYIYLTEEEALDEAMKIEKLKNGTEYVVQYTQTQNAPDGVQGNSNTLSETPLDTPNPPQILINDEYFVIVEKNSNVYTIKLWVDYGVGTYNPPLEKTTFKIISRTKSEMQIVSQEFDLLSQHGRYKQFELTNLTNDLYAISCFNINNNGVGPLSNVIEVDVGDLPFPTEVTQVVSGLDGKLDVYVSTSQNYISDFNITQFNIYYAIPSDSSLNNYTWVYASSLTNLTVVNGIVTANGFVTGLTNGTKYLIKAVAVNKNGIGVSRNNGKGVPAKHSSVSNVTITNANANGGIVNATWNMTNGTFGPTAYTYKLERVVNNDIFYIYLGNSGFGETMSISLTDLNITAGEILKLHVTPHDTVTQGYLSYWVTPPLVHDDHNWDGETVISDSYTVNNKPESVTSIVCSSVGDGSLTYTFNKPNYSDYNAPTKYTIELSTSSGFEVDNIIESVDITNLTLSSNTFTGLTNYASYYARIFASNDYGISGNVSTGPNQPLESIAPIIIYGPLQGVKVSSSGILPKLYRLNISWDPFEQDGYTLVDYTINVYRRVNGTPTLVSTENTTSTEYSYVGTVNNTYYFGIIVNATINQSINGLLNSSISSEDFYSNIIFVLDNDSVDPSGNTQTGNGNGNGNGNDTQSIPFINNVTFDVDSSGNGKISFDVDDKLSKLKGIFTLVLPISNNSVQPGANIFQTQPTYYPLPSSIVGKRMYTANLTYKIPSNNQAYVIYAVNEQGASFISRGLST
jgi:hypothetical protein